MKKNDVYKGFEVLDCFDVKIGSAKAVYLRHKKSGLEVLHLLNDDSENLFAFAFRTHSENGKGAAHIAEHSVLCGSRKFPMKDPFLQLKNQSVSTYLNAYTSKDKTVFPASSLIKSDYFHLMEVYADAVFFPLLKREVFLQEGWRLEEENGGQKIQGVVFNEMKGCYSSFGEVAYDEIYNASVRGTSFEKDSGGDPLEIPDLTYDEFKAFHKKFYCAKNCLVFLCGNIPTEEQLDFLDENVISKLNGYGEKFSFANLNSTVKMQKRISAQGPEEGDKSVTALVWKIGGAAENENLFLLPMQIGFLSELLFGADSSPVIKSILKKFPECEISSVSGCSISSRFFSVTIGVKGLAENRAEEFKDFVFETLEFFCRNGIPSEDLERAFLSYDFSACEIKRSSSNGPYSLVLLSRALRAWVYEKNPRDTLSFSESFGEIKSAVKKNPVYFSELMKKFFLCNENFSLVTVTPSAQWSRKRMEAEKKLTQVLFKKIGAEKIKSDSASLEKFQDAEEKNFIPSVKKENLENSGKKICTQKSVLRGVPFFYNEEFCNGIVYASVSFPVDVLDASDYKFLNLLCACIPDMGTKKKSWEETLSKSATILGNFGAYIRTASVPKNSLWREKKNPLLVGRDWLVIHFKFLEEKSADAFAFVAETISSIDFSDSARLSVLKNSLSSSLSSGVVPNGHYFALVRSARKMNRSCAVQEIKDGITSVFDAKEICRMNQAELEKKLGAIYRKIISSGGIFHVTADKNSIVQAKKNFVSFAEKISLSFPKPKRKNRDENFFRQTEISGKSTDAKKILADEIFLVPGSVSFASASVESSDAKIRRVMADSVFAHLAETTDFWKAVRMAGGAYGVFLSVRSSCGATFFATYRDPKPLESLKFFFEYFKSLRGKKIPAEEFEKSVAGVYSSETEPYTPFARGETGIMRKLYGGNENQDFMRLDALLKISAEDVEKSAERFSQAQKKGSAVLICGKDLASDKIFEFSGKIIEVPI